MGLDIKKIEFHSGVHEYNSYSSSGTTTYLYEKPQHVIMVWR